MEVLPDAVDVKDRELEMLRVSESEYVLEIDVVGDVVVDRVSVVLAVDVWDTLLVTEYGSDTDVVTDTEEDIVADIEYDNETLCVLKMEVDHVKEEERIRLDDIEADATTDDVRVLLLLLVNNSDTDCDRENVAD